MSPDPRLRRLVIGVDTHTYEHVAVALDDIGGRIGAASFPANRAGYEQLLDWAAGFGARRLVFAIEGTGSYGAGLTSAVRRRDIGVIEVIRTDRRDRRLRGKSDTRYAPQTCQREREFDNYRSINALMENFWSTLKIELVYRTSWRTRDQAENAIFTYIDGWYNTSRIQLGLGDLSPDEYEAAWYAANIEQPDPSGTTLEPTGAR